MSDSCTNAAPSATLHVPAGLSGDRLGSSKGQALQVLDFDGDGSLDVFAATERADVGGVQDTGALYLWKDGTLWSGTTAPNGDLTVPGAVAGDRLTYL